MNLLKKIGMFDRSEQVSITNLTVMVFVAITAFKSLFSGVSLELLHVQWKIEGMDLASVLPLLFSLLNYSNKKMQETKVYLAQGSQGVKNEQ